MVHDMCSVYIIQIKNEIQGNVRVKHVSSCSLDMVQMAYLNLLCCLINCVLFARYCVHPG